MAKRPTKKVYSDEEVSPVLPKVSIKKAPPKVSKKVYSDDEISDEEVSPVLPKVSIKKAPLKVSKKVISSELSESLSEEDATPIIPKATKGVFKAPVKKAPPKKAPPAPIKIVTSSESSDSSEEDMPVPLPVKKAKALPKKAVPKKAVPKKAVSIKQRTLEPDPSDEVFAVLDNIIDETCIQLDDEFDNIPVKQKPLIELVTFVPQEKPTVTHLVPYFNPEESSLFAHQEYNIQHCVLFINKLLTSEKSLVLETKILSLLNGLSISTNAFWTELAWSKDIISYKLNQRNFPTYQLIEKETTSDVDPNDLKTKVDIQQPVDEFSTETSEPQKLIELSDRPSQTLEWPRKSRTKFANPKNLKTYSKFKKSDIQPLDQPTDNQVKEEVIRKKYDLGRPGGLQATLDQTYVDEGVTMRDGIRQYNVLQQEKYTSILTYDMVNHIFTVCAEKKAYPVMLSLFCRLVASRELCHFAFTPTVFRLMFARDKGSPFNDPEYLEIIHHSMFYGFYLMYKEECTIKSMANQTHRCVYDLETVQYFPVYDGALSENPYIPLTLSTKYMYAETIPTDQYLFKPMRVANTERGVYTFHSAQARINIFTDGVFNGVNWDKLAMTGSVMPACVIRNPLEKLFGINLPMTDDLANPDTARAYWKNPVNRQNVENYFDEYYPSKNVLDPGYLTEGHPKYEELPGVTDKLSDIDIIVEFGDDNDFDRKVLEVFEIVKKNVEHNHEQNPTKYPSNKVQMVRITTPASYKYQIVGPGLHKNIELFRIFVHPLGCISRFHFPCVRSLYTGESIKLFPSMISAAFTGMLLEYKWMSSAKQTKDLVCKYYSRGFTLIMNELEHNAMRQHILDHQTWNYLMAANDNERSISILNPIFKPRQNRAGIYAGLANLNLKPAPIYKYPVPMANFDTYWVSTSKKSIYGFPLDFRFPAGHIQPPHAWHIEPYIEKLQSSLKYASTASDASAAAL
jgi:hypothetical protein